ncbi:MAG: hypothetical protein H7836_14100, partial [Magnetococcus sp. YQC-3]
ALRAIPVRHAPHASRKAALEGDRHANKVQKKRNKVQEQKHDCIQCDFYNGMNRILVTLDDLLDQIGENFIKTDSVKSVFFIDGESVFYTNEFMIDMDLVDLEGNPVDNDDIYFARMGHLIEVLSDFGIDNILLETALFFYYKFNLEEGCHTLKNLTIKEFDPNTEDEKEEEE